MGPPQHFGPGKLPDLHTPEAALTIVNSTLYRIYIYIYIYYTVSDTFVQYCTCKLPGEYSV